MNEIEQYIRAAAAARGIDPDIAVRVALSEGGLTNPFQQSNVRNNGVRETSYGPFQLLMGGGLGDEAMAAGIDPRKNWKGGVDFALTKAGQGGWGPWYGAAKAGIGNREGIGDVGAGLSAKPVPGNLGPPDPGGTNVFTPGMQTGTTLTSTPAPGSPATPSGPDWESILGDKDSPLASIGKALGGGGGGDPNLTQITPSSIGAETGSPVAAQAAQLMMQLMSDRRKRYMGRTLTSGLV